LWGENNTGGKIIMAQEFKTIKEVRDYIAEYDDKIRCLECGKFYSTLDTHLQRIHKITGDEYKEKYKIPYSYALVSPNAKKKMSDNLKKSIALGFINKEVSSKQNIEKLIKIAKEGSRRICPHRLELSLEHLKKIPGRKKKQKRVL